MKQTTILALLAASLALASQHAHHGHHHALHEKRALVITTDTVVHWVDVTKTVTAGAYAATPDSEEGADHDHKEQGKPHDSAAEHSSSSVTFAAEKETPPAEGPAPVVTHAAASPSVAAAAVSPPAHHAPAPAPAPKPAPKPAPAPAPAGPAPAQASGGMQSGDITYYNAVGLSTCGYDLSNTNNTVAVALSLFHSISNAGYGQPSSPLCNRKINMYPSGVGKEAVELIVADGCAGCDAQSLDLPHDFFMRVMPDLNGEAPATVGRYSGVEWEWLD